MNHTICTRLTTLCFVFVPTVSACALTDVAGNVDAGSVGGQPSTGGTQSYDDSTGEQASTGGAAASTGGAAASTGGSTASINIQAGIDCSSTAPTPLPTWDVADGCVTGNELAQFVGTWEGYIHGTAIGDEASTIRLKILGANSNGLCGTVTFGIDTAPVTLPPVTDPAAVYPPESIAPSYSTAGSAPILGLAYTMQGGQVLGQRATFQLAYSEVFKDWCSVQTSYPASANCLMFTCEPGDEHVASSSSPSYSYYSTNPDLKFYDTMSRMMMCKGPGICECNVAQCAAVNKYNTLFDLTFNNDQALGTLGAQVVTFDRAGCAKSGGACQSNSDCCDQLCVASGADVGTVCK